MYQINQYLFDLSHNEKWLSNRFVSHNFSIYRRYGKDAALWGSVLALFVIEFAKSIFVELSLQ